jgi:hypothetical protein
MPYSFLGTLSTYRGRGGGLRQAAANSMRVIVASFATAVSVFTRYCVNGS